MANHKLSKCAIGGLVGFSLAALAALPAQAQVSENINATATVAQAITAGESSDLLFSNIIAPTDSSTGFRVQCNNNTNITTGSGNGSWPGKANAQRGSVVVSGANNVQFQATVSIAQNFNNPGLTLRRVEAAIGNQLCDWGGQQQQSITRIGEFASDEIIFIGGTVDVAVNATTNGQEESAVINVQVDYLGGPS